MTNFRFVSFGEKLLGLLLTAMVVLALVFQGASYLVLLRVAEERTAAKEPRQAPAAKCPGELKAAPRRPTITLPEMKISGKVKKRPPKKLARVEEVRTATAVEPIELVFAGTP